MRSQHVMILTRAVVFNEADEVLVQHEPASENDFYRLPGGKVEFREKLEDGVVREIEEETGLKAKVIRLLWVRDFLGHLIEHSIEFFFLATIVGGSPEEKTRAGQAFLFMRLEEIEKTVFYPKVIVPRLNLLRKDRDWAGTNPYIRSAN